MDCYCASASELLGVLLFGAGIGLLIASLPFFDGRRP